MLLMWMGVIAVLLLGWTAWAAHQLESLPYAPECPDCRGVTTHRLRLSRMDHLFTSLGGADNRHCARCGWNGRMRWRLAEARAHRD